jgi:5-methylcytosine-specific restriction endonuclease McrA
MRVCSGSGCLRAVADGVRFCDECKPSNAASDGIRTHSQTDREQYAFLYSGPRWQRLRVQVIKEHPICDRCQLSISTIADHIVPAGVAIVQAQESRLYPADKYAGFYLKSNLQGLCAPCHRVKTIEDKTHSGPWLDVIAREQAAPKRVWTF